MQEGSKYNSGEFRTFTTHSDSKVLTLLRCTFTALAVSLLNQLQHKQIELIEVGARNALGIHSGHKAVYIHVGIVGLSHIESYCGVGDNFLTLPLKL